MAPLAASAAIRLPEGPGLRKPASVVEHRGDLLAVQAELLVVARIESLRGEAEGLAEGVEHPQPGLIPVPQAGDPQLLEAFGLDGGDDRLGGGKGAAPRADRVRPLQFRVLLAFRLPAFILRLPAVVLLLGKFHRIGGAVRQVHRHFARFQGLCLAGEDLGDVLVQEPQMVHAGPGADREGVVLRQDGPDLPRALPGEDGPFVFLLRVGAQLLLPLGTFVDGPQDGVVHLQAAEGLEREAVDSADTAVAVEGYLQQGPVAAGLLREGRGGEDQRGGDPGHPGIQQQHGGADVGQGLEGQRGP